MASPHVPTGSELQEHLHSKEKNDKASLDNKELIIRVPRYFLESRSILVFQDVCQAVLRSWGSYSKLHNLLRKLGIETCRFDQSQLRALKNIGAVDLQTKQCSFISEEDFFKILQKYDVDSNTDNAKYIQLSPPVVIDDHCSNENFQENQNGKEHYEAFHATPPALHVFSIGNQDFVALSEMSRLFEAHFQRPDLLNSVLQNLNIAMGTFTDNELAKVEIHTGVTCSDGLRRLYITRKDAERGWQYTSALLDTNPPNVNWVQLGKLNVGVTTKEISDRQDNVPVALTSSSAIVHTPENGIDEQGAVVSTEKCTAASTSQSNLSDVVNPSASQTSNTSNSNTRCVIRTCLVDDEVVVCIPDLHKTVIDLYGQSVQVGKYMHRLRIPTHRFSSICLKRLKAHNILSSKATLCTYITKADAKRLLKMYHLGNYCHSDNNSGDSFPRIEWSKPIILETAAANNSSEGGPNQAESMHIPQVEIAKLKIPLFTINQQVVVSMPDVHKAVQLLNGHSVQLHYNLDKLRVTKHKYTYSEVHHLKVLGYLNRPSTCTYITKADMERLLQYYTTPENVARLKLIEWKLPIAVENIADVTAYDGMSSPEVESAGTEIDDEKNADGKMAEDYSISDLYKVFVGDDLETTQRSSHEDANQSEKILQPTTPLSPSSSSSSVHSFLPLSPHVSASITRSEVHSISEQQRASASSSSHMSRSRQSCDSSSTSQDVVNFNQMQGDFGRSEYNPERTSSESCFDRHTVCIPVATKEMGVSSQSYSQVAPPSSSSFSTVPYCNTVQTSGVTSCASPIAAMCTATSARDGGLPPPGSSFTHYGNFHCSSKRPNESSSNGPTLLEQQAKKYRADDEDTLKTLQRKETEMKILHDAYQEQIKRERERRLAVQQELDQLKDSNAELLKSIERKELEMKILHDSYKLQMDLEKKKREELEIEVLQLRDQLGGGTCVTRVKQEPL